MALYAQTVKQFVAESYQLISASSPVVPLHGSDTNTAVNVLNRLLKSYSSSGLLTTIAQKINFTLPEGQLFATFGDASYVPTPTVTQGRLSNLERAWLSLDGVDYPLINEDRGVFFGSYKYFPQLGLPRFVIVTNDLNVTTLQFYPGPSQPYEVWIYGKFELPYLTENDTMVNIPYYQYMFLQFALARFLAFYKGRSSAWDAKLEAMYKELEDQMESVSTIDLVIDSANESYLNGSWRLRAGI
jgi:hypothetical protein